MKAFSMLLALVLQIIAVSAAVDPTVNTLTADILALSLTIRGLTETIKANQGEFPTNIANLIGQFGQGLALRQDARKVNNDAKKIPSALDSEELTAILKSIKENPSNNDALETTLQPAVSELAKALIAFKDLYPVEVVSQRALA